MDDPVHGRHAAIYATERKRLPPSFYLAVALAGALHVGGAYYLLQTRFVQALPDPLPAADSPPTVVTMERPDKPKPQPPNVVRVHAAPQPAEPDSPPIIPNPGPTVLDKIDGPPVLPSSPPGDIGTTLSDGGGSASMVAARWSRFPNGDALTDYYPRRAADAEIEGQATVQCTVLDSAGRVSCVVISESPGGFGFGAATVRMVQDKGRVDTSHGDVATGSMLRQTVNWRLN